MSPWGDKGEPKAVSIKVLYFSQFFFGQIISLLFKAKGKSSVPLSERLHSC